MGKYRETEITFGNFRDMGGLAVPGGEIKRGKLFRTCRLKPKTEADRAFLESLGLECVIDLRVPQEIREKPDELPKGVEYVNASVFGDTKFQVLAPTTRSKLALGRSKEQAKEEYMLSTVKRAHSNSRIIKLIKKLPLRDELYEVVNYSSRVHEELFDTAYDAIFSRYPTIEDFLSEEYGVTAENLADWKKFYTTAAK